MSAGCRLCGHVPSGAPRRARGSLHLAGNPVEIFADGLKLALSPMRKDILALLVRKGNASHEELLALRSTMTAESLKVTIFYLRKLLPADMEIRNDHGHGYILAERAT